jgi:hypothetical protein
MDNIICQFNKDSETYIYHFTDEKLLNTQNIINITNDENIYYEKIEIKNFLNNFDRNLEKIIKKCEENNILIVINSNDDISDLLTKFNHFINKLKLTECLLHNVTIINITNNNKKVLYYEKNKNNDDIFKKIVNVFPTKGDLFINDEAFFEKTLLNINIPKTLDTQKNIMFTFKQKGGEIKNIIIRVMDTESKTKMLQDQWWFLWYFSIPSCANIRLLQATGTCWLNSAINSLFLIEDIAEIMKKRFEENKNKEEYKIKFRDYEKIKNLKILCNSLVYNLIIQKTKAKYDDGNFLAHLSTLVKCEYTNQPKKCKNKNFGNGGDTFQAIKILFKYILQNNDYTHINIYNIISGYDEYSELWHKYKKIYDEYTNLINEYNIEIKKQYYDEYKVKKLKSKIEDYNEVLNLYVKKLKNLEENTKNISIRNYNIENIDLYKNNNLNKILFLCGEFDNNIKTNIKIKENKYKLCSCIIQLKSKKMTHVITGIVCKNIYYIYDSNNLFFRCNWNKGESEIKNIFEQAKFKKIYGNTMSFDHIYVLIYIKE